MLFKWYSYILYLCFKKIEIIIIKIYLITLSFYRILQVMHLLTKCYVKKYLKKYFFT